MSHLRLASAERPVVSVAIVTYGGGPWLEQALEALRDHTDEPFETLVVDNASPDGTGAWLAEHVGGVRLIRGSRNVGFGPAANLAASHARGRLLCFLNPDAIVEPGWLPPLIAALEDPEVGAAAPALLNMDGSLQEAGSLVGGDAQTWAIGAGGDPADGRYAFPVGVHYASAACLLVRRGVFAEVGGFDPAYQPAYVEDVDLCLSLGRRGLRVVCEPRSRVRHVRSASTDLARAQRLIEDNRTILHRRWRRVLAKRPPLAESWHYTHRPIAARDFDITDRILVTADRVPSLDPDDPDADVAGLLTDLRARWPGARITLVASGDVQGNTAALARLGIEVGAGRKDWAEWFEARRYHATAVIRCGGAGFDPLLEETQPQAPRWDLRADPAGPLEEALAGLGMPPPGADPVGAGA